MVFGDNVRARRAARAPPRTPTQRGRGRRRWEKRERKNTPLTPSHTAFLPLHINHHRYSTMTQPCHKDTTLNQQCCDSKHRERREEQNGTQFRHRTSPPTTNTATHKRKGSEDDIKGQRHVKGRTQSEHGGQHTPTAPAIQWDHHANRKGDTNTRQEGHQHSTRPSFIMPPHLVMPPRHPRWPHPPRCEGEGGQRIPHHTNSTDTRTPPTRHTPGNGQYTTRQQYSPALQWDE